ncbi:urease subunit beta [Actinocorallia sp. A-T 12471]|nr:urease subunit beta [Actinocorallia sp. A-T 12471]MDX6740434.1 urease subunit beta [Actinocorallia sp. A-T 12471]
MSDDGYLYGEGDIELNAGQPRVTLTVHNTGDRAVQVGSHFHFFESNRALSFDRDKAFGKRLDIPAGTAVRFEPGDTKQVTLVEYGGGLRLVGFGGLLNGSVRSAAAHREALRRMRERGYLDQPDGSASTPGASGADKPSKKSKSGKKG